jgi:hypothetical protein
LSEELHAALAMLPARDRGASAMSRALKVDRVTCQRIVTAANKANVNAGVLVRAPGIEGLRQFVAAMSARRGSRANAEQLAALSAAIDRFEVLLIQVGGSQRKLRTRLESSTTFDTPVEASGADDPGVRESLFRSAAATTGRWSTAVSDVRIVRPVPDQPHLTEGLRVRGMFGHISRPNAIPLEIGEATPLQSPTATEPAFSTLDSTPATGATPSSLLPAFCTLPLPRVISRAAGPRVVHQIDTGSATAATPSDIVLAHRTSQPDRHPATLDPPLGEMWFMVTFPVQRMVFDVFLHREIARRCIPSLELHLWGPDAGRHGSSRWSTRFPGGPRLEVLGSGLGAAATPAYSRHAELLRSVFDQVGWDPDEFAGYRCEVTYPVWRAGYCMLFDFAGNEIPSPS